MPRQTTAPGRSGQSANAPGRGGKSTSAPVRHGRSVRGGRDTDSGSHFPEINPVYLFGQFEPDAPSMAGVLEVVATTPPASNDFIGALQPLPPVLAGTLTNFFVNAFSGALTPPAPTMAGIVGNVSPNTFTGALAPAAPDLFGFLTVGPDPGTEITGALVVPVPVMIGTLSNVSPNIFAGALAPLAPTMAGVITNQTPIFISGALSIPVPTMVGALATGGASGGSSVVDFIAGTTSGANLSDFSVTQSQTLTAANNAGQAISFGANTKRITDRGWYISSAQGDVTAIGGAIAATLATAAWTITLDIDIDTATASAINGIALGANSEIIRVNGFSSISSGATTAAVGIGGMQGIAKIAITAAGLLCCNSGTVQSASAITVSGILRLFSGLSGFVRKVNVQPVNLTSAQLQSATSIIGQNFVNAQSALAFSTAINTLTDDMTGALRTRSGNTDTSPVAPDVLPMVALYSTSELLMPRYVFHTRDAGGSFQEPINQEWQAYLDPQRTGNYNPHSQSGSVRSITMQHVDNLTSGQRALVGIDPNRGAQYQYVSGCLTSAGVFEQKFGYFEARMKLPNGPKLWPAFWLLPARRSGVRDFNSKSELDVVEVVGFGNPGYDTATMHWDNYASNPGAEHFWPYDLSQDYHTYGCHWAPGVVRAYRDGVLMTTINTGGNFDEDPMYILFNLAVGGSWPGDPTAATKAAMPAVMDIDYVRVWTVT